MVVKIQIALPALAAALALTLSVGGASAATGTIKEFSVPGQGYPVSITTGPDGNLWFTEEFANEIGRITPSGAIDEFTVPVGVIRPIFATNGSVNQMFPSAPVAIAAG